MDLWTRYKQGNQTPWGVLITCSYWSFTDIEYYPLILQLYMLHHKVSRNVRHFLADHWSCILPISAIICTQKLWPVFEDFLRGTIIFLYRFLTDTWYIIKRYVRKKCNSWKIIAIPFCNYKGHYLLRMCNRVRGKKMNNFTFHHLMLVLSND